MGYISKEEESKPEDGISPKLEYDKDNVIHLDEIPDPNFDMTYSFVNDKYYKYVTATVRRTIEYREYIQFLKQQLDVDHCSFYEGYSMKNGFIIELHHAPFTLYDYVETVCTKYMHDKGFVETFKVVEEVNKLHYLFEVGLTPLNPTAHKLVHAGALTVHPKIILGNWKQFYGEYAAFASEAVVKKYNDALTLESKLSSPNVPNILEYAPTKLVSPLQMITGQELDQLVIESKMKAIEKL